MTNLHKILPFIQLLIMFSKWNINESSIIILYYNYSVISYNVTNSYCLLFKFKIILIAAHLNPCHFQSKFILDSCKSQYYPILFPFHKYIRNSCLNNSYIITYSNIGVIVSEQYVEYVFVSEIKFILIG